LAITYKVISSPGVFTAIGTTSPITTTGLTNGTTYTFTVTATNSFGTGAASVSSNTVTPNTGQTVSFGSAPTITFGGSGTVSASATSGLAVSFSSTTPSICTVLGSTVSGIAVGTCTVTATQPGNASYIPATQTQSFTIDKGTQTVSFGSAPTITFGGSGSVSASATSGLAVSFPPPHPASAPSVAAPLAASWRAPA